MPEEHPVDNPTQAMENMRDAMRKILTVSKSEILRREREANIPARNGKPKRNNGASNVG